MLILSFSLILFLLLVCHLFLFYVDGTAYNETMNFFDLMFQIANKPSIYVLDTPGVLVPSISDIETGLKLALAGTVSID